VIETKITWVKALGSNVAKPKYETCWDDCIDQIVLKYSDLNTLILLGIVCPLNVNHLLYIPESSFKNDYLLTELVLGVLVHDINEGIVTNPIGTNTHILREEFLYRVGLNFDDLRDYRLAEFLESHTTIFDFNSPKGATQNSGGVNPKLTRITLRRDLDLKAVLSMLVNKINLQNWAFHIPP
jgi:hypothetical protein